jgi:hypothetical protein
MVTLNKSRRFYPKKAKIASDFSSSHARVIKSTETHLIWAKNAENKENKNHS